MKYKEIRIEIKSIHELKNLDDCPHCHSKLEYRNSSCYCEREKKEFIYFVVTDDEIKNRAKELTKGL